MVKTQYQAEINGKQISKAMAKNKDISIKYATEMCRELRGKPLAKSVAYLQRVIDKEDFLPLKRYNGKVGHRKGASKSGVKSGRFPQKLCKVFTELLEQIKANADFKGLDAEKLLIVHAFASQGFSRTSFQSKGRIAGKRRKSKSTHVEIITRETKA